MMDSSAWSIRVVRESMYVAIGSGGFWDRDRSRFSRPERTIVSNESDFKSCPVMSEGGG